MQTADTFSSTWEDYKGSVFNRHKSRVSRHSASWITLRRWRCGMNITIHRQLKSHHSASSYNKRSLFRASYFISAPCTVYLHMSHVYLYDLQRQRLVKKLFNGGQTISCSAVVGDNIITGDGDGKLVWFDMDLSNMPYKVMVCIQVRSEDCISKNFPLLRRYLTPTVHVLMARPLELNVHHRGRESTRTCTIRL